MTTSRTTKVFALSFGRGLTTLVTLVVGMVLARVLSKTDLATYRQTMLAYDVAIPLLSLGLASGMYYFLPTEKDRARGVVVDGLVIMAGMGLLYAVFIALGGNHLLARRFSNPAIVNTLVYLVPLPILMLPEKLLPPVMVVQNQVTTLSVYNVLRSLLLASTVIAACLWWKTPDAMILVRVGVSLLIGMAALRLMWRAVPKDDWRPRWGSMKRMLAYSLPMVGATAMGAISVQLDKLIVSSMCLPEQFAVYSNGAIQIPLVAILTGSIAAVIQPDLRRLVADGNRAGALALFRQASLKSAVILMPAMVFLFFSAKPFILFMFSSRYMGSILPFQLYLLILPIRIVNFGVFMLAFGLTRVIMIRSLIGLIANLILSVALVRWIGYLGAIIGTIISLYSVNCVLNFAVLSRSAGCRWWQVVPFRELSRIIGVSLLAALPMLLLHLVPVPWQPAQWLPVQWPPVVVQGVVLGVNAMLFGVALALGVWGFRIVTMQEEARRVWRKIIQWVR